MKKVLISRYGAYGDILHCSHLPRLLKENGFDYVAVDTNFKGYQIFAENPYVDKTLFFELTTDTLEAVIEKRWRYISGGYDRFINLYKSIEYASLAMEDQDMYYRSDEVRREFGRGNYYDIATRLAGFPELCGKYRGEVYYTPEEHRIVERYISNLSGRFIVLVNLSGTGPHKRLVQAQEIVDHILTSYDDAVVIQTGDKTCRKIERGNWAANRLLDIAGVVPFRQSLLIAKHVDCVIGCESGLMVGANMWGTPTIQLMTAASIENHANGCEGDLSIQSPASCSPCHRGPYRYLGCPRRDGLPICVYFDLDAIFTNIRRAYEQYSA